MNGIVGAYVDAVEAVDAPRSVHDVVAQVNALTLAYILASAAMDAPVSIYIYLEYGETAHQP